MTVGIDRGAILRNAGNLLRQGKVDLAIAEYERAVAERPGDWNTANLLGDLYVRVGRVDQAVEQYGQMARGLRAQGFLHKAAAVYKKVLKLEPDNVRALVEAARVAGELELTADARAHLDAAAEYLVRRGDREGLEQIRARLAALDAPAETAADRDDPAPEAEPEVQGSTPVDSRPPEHASPAPARAEEAGAGVPLDEFERALEAIGTYDGIELTVVDRDAAAPVPPVPIEEPTLEATLAVLRDEAARKSRLGAAQAAYERGLRLSGEGRADEAVAAFEEAARHPALRFVGAAAAARIHRQEGRLAPAIEWFDRAARAPAPTPDEGRAMRYELAATLEEAGQTSRALAVTRELQAPTGSGRDPAARGRRTSPRRTRG